MGYTVFRPEELAFQPPKAGDQNRRIAGLSEAMTQMRANVWRYAPGTCGRRHADRVQEEVFVVVEGAPTMHLGDPPERVDLTAGSVVVVQAGTPLQLRNESETDAVLFIVGAPPEPGQADFLPDAE